MKLKDSIILILAVVVAIVVGVFVGIKLTEKKNEDNKLQNNSEINNNLNDNSSLKCETKVETISYVETGKRLFAESLKKNGAIDYKINSADLFIGCSKEFVLEIDFDIKANGNPYELGWDAGNGVVEGNWVKNKVYFVTFELENGVYKVGKSVTGYGNYVSCINGRAEITPGF